MIDFFASATIALIIIMTLVLFLSNLRQARILNQMQDVVKDWYNAQMRDRRDTFQSRVEMPDVFEWVGSQVGLTVVDQARKLENPSAVEFLTAEGARLVISPLKKHRLRSDLRAVEGKRRKVSNLVQPLLGYRPGKVKVTEKSNETVHEWYEVEIETAAKKLGVSWENLTALYFYVIPQEATREKAPFISFDFSSIQQQVKKLFSVKEAREPKKVEAAKRPEPKVKRKKPTIQGEVKKILSMKEAKAPGKGEVKKSPAPKVKRKKTTTKQASKPLAADMKGGKK